VVEFSNISKLGFGSYRVSVNNSEHFQAINQAISYGCNLIDTAPNYSNGESESLIGKVIRENSKKDLFIITKVGYIHGQDLELAKKFNSSIKISENSYYSLNVDFIDHQLEKSLKRLNRNYIDCLLIHNPEHYFKAENFAKDKLYDLVASAFQYLEDKVKEGKIRYYGISSNTLPFSVDTPTTLDIVKIGGIASTISKNHHFKVIQFPFNIKEQEALISEHSNKKSLINWSKELGLITIANRPLNCKILNGALRLASYKDNEIGNIKFDDTQPFDLVFEKILDQLSKHGMKDQWTEFPILTHLKDKWDKIGNPEAVEAIFHDHFYPFLNSVYEMHIPKEESLLINSLFSSAILYSKHNTNLQAKKIESELIASGILPSGAGSLPAKACSHYLNQGINHVLVGMRKSQYVDEFKSLF
jgi:aryl-alcohol dehydrogenase-like predicted oxidoreductase